MNRDLAVSFGGGTGDQELIVRRQRVLGPAYRLLYEHPVHFVRAEGVHLYDPDGREYLDAYNNVPCVGHSHPRVREAVSHQLGLINTNTRYLQRGVVEYAEQLLDTFPKELGNVMFTCTGSEANDLALRVAQFNTGNTGIIITENAYHGTTAAIAGISPSLGPGVQRPSNVRTIAAPDQFMTGFSEEAMSNYMVAQVREAVEDLTSGGYGVCSLILDSIFSSDGLLSGPVTWMEPAARIVRAAGGLLIADEVQSGFGRLGAGMWGFARHGVVPDIVTMGKSMGNGYPVASAVFRPHLLETFGPTVRYFNTFGGSSAAVAAAAAVLHTIQDDDLVSRAKTVGEEIQSELAALAESDSRIGCVRGAGLAIGVALVHPDKEGPVGDPLLASAVVNTMREKHILISSCGVDGSVLKIRPPLVFSPSDGRRLIDTFSEVLDELQ